MKLVHLLVGTVSVRTVPTRPRTLSRQDERGLSQSTEIALLTGAVLLGVVTAAGLAPDLESSVWLDGGRHLWFVPLVAPVVAGVWMWMSDPRRIVVRAERQLKAAP